ncbi:GNAT family N-acetyltransferase [Bowmanella dokdonensis]|uniref:GNAT family N-acetyltransferase n=1 Tax=Bowmanella dokdonensis TaxID=751969 RepID=A0A939DR16_9ALTE|nr:GNAT family N-acetyltransferase [Bowmanella dokdonensis]MBN7827242.1 GNAT family N-acetyltransferase [Bowmanella dokdonensis]
MQIRLDDLSGPEIARFLQQHIEDMRSISPPESKHALDLEGLRQPQIRFWTVWDSNNLIGCGAIKALDPHHGEIKSMRTAAQYRGRGVASTLLQHILDQARQSGHKKVSLETGSMDFFAPARALYARHGFQICGPFAQYKDDPNSVFMTLDIA